MRLLKIAFLALVVLAAAAVLAADPSQFAYPIAGAPLATVSVSTTSASASLAGSTCYRVACSVPVFWRVGVLPLTALTSDNATYGPAVELICLRSTYTGMAFVTLSGTGTCSIHPLASSP